MARLARCIVPGYPHHVVQRGNYEQNIFGSDDDYRYYLSLLKECADRYAIDIWAYCLMPNHVHVICVPKEERGAGPGLQHPAYALCTIFQWETLAQGSPLAGPLHVVRPRRVERAGRSEVRGNQSRAPQARRAGRGLSLVERPMPHDRGAGPGANRRERYGSGVEQDGGRPDVPGDPRLAFLSRLRR